MDLLPEHLHDSKPAKYIIEMAHSKRRKQIACKHAAEQRLCLCEERLVHLQEELLAINRDHWDVEHSISILRTLFIQATNDPQDGHMQSLEVSRQMPPMHSNPMA